MKKLKDLKEGETIYKYGVNNTNSGEFVYKTKLTVQYPRILGTKYFIRGVEDLGGDAKYIHRIDCDEGIVYRNSVWLAEENDEEAENLLLNEMNNKIQKAYHNIDVYKRHINMIQEFFGNL